MHTKTRMTSRIADGRWNLTNIPNPNLNLMSIRESVCHPHFGMYHKIPTFCNLFLSGQFALYAIIRLVLLSVYNSFK
jgi:hypothetical protein